MEYHVTYDVTKNGVQAHRQSKRFSTRFFALKQSKMSTRLYYVRSNEITFFVVL